VSLFKTKGIIIKKIDVGEKDMIYDIFTYDFGRIKAKKKIKAREKPLDTGYIANFEIETRE
jgi:recombinational DNA repair protein (RecF pathway)